jgi:RNA polymerase sigma factor (sigma-70 family)
MGTQGNRTRETRRRPVARDESAESSGLGSVLGDSRSVEALGAKLTQLAWFRYRIPALEAEDVLQNTFAAYLEVRDRYAVLSEHRAILVGIFRKKCLEHIERSVREKQRLSRYCTTPDAARENPWIRPASATRSASVLDELVRDETRGRILEAIAALRPSSRQIATLIGRDGLGRADLIEQLELNKNTFDSRLHACRAQLRGLLRRRDVSFAVRTKRGSTGAGPCEPGIATTALS